MKEHVIRLIKGQDLKIEIEKYCEEKNISAGSIICCVGCVSKANIRDASGVNCVNIDKHLEIVSICGTVSKNGCHIHISLSDEQLYTYGGHLKDGCIINTTAEIVILELESFEFTREIDESTGYKELKYEKIK